MNILKDLAAAIASGGIETPPPEWMTAVQHAKTAGLSIQQTSHILRAGRDAGRVEVRAFRILSGSRVYPVPHYRVKP